MNSPNSSEPDPLRRLEIAATMPAIDGHCDTHGPFQSKVLMLFADSRVMRSRCPVCTAEAQELKRIETEKREAEERQRITLMRFRRAGIPERFIDRTFKTYVPTTPAQRRALSIAQAFADSREPGRSLIMCGKPGTGKTHLACAIANAMVLSGSTAYFATVLAAVRHVKDTYRRDSERSESEAIEDLTKPSVLILDEVGAQIGSEHEKLILFEVINERYANCMPTILLSNLTQDELTTYLGERVMDRFREGGAVIAFDWESHRGKRAA